MTTDGPMVATFVTAANDKYFFMCGILLQSLKKHFPGIKCFVMDIGLSRQQQEFFAAKDILLRMPENLSVADHPYKLKSSMGLFLDDRVEGTPIWIDSDMMAVSQGKDALLDILKGATAGQHRFAMTPDEGHFKTVADFAAFSSS